VALKPLLNENSSEMSLPLFATAPFGALLNVYFDVVLLTSGAYFEKPNFEKFFLEKVFDFVGYSFLK